MVEAKLETHLAPPATMPNGLQSSDEGLWVIDQGNDFLYLLDSELKALREIPTVTENGSGLTIGDGYFWIGSNAPANARYPRPTDWKAPCILKCDMETGELVARYPTPDGGGIHGLEWIDGLLWITCFRPQGMRLIDPKDFRVLKSIEVPYPWPHGLAWDGEGMWMSHTGLKIIVKYDVETGKELECIQYAEDAPAPHGFTIWNGDMWSCDANWPSPVHPDGPSFSRILR